MKKSTKKRTIFRDKVWVDPEIVNTAHRNASNYRVKYYLYNDNKKNYIPKDPKKEFRCEEHTGVCFSRLLGILSGLPKGDNIKQVNRLYYDMGIGSDPCVKLTKEEITRYLELAKEHRFLPKQIDVESIVKNQITVLHLNNTMTPAQIYVYLCAIRFIREYAGIVKSVVYLMDNHPTMSFAAALAVGTRIGSHASGHHFLSISGKYGEEKEVVNTAHDIPFHLIVGLQRFIKKPSEYTKETIFNQSGGFDANNSISGISKLNNTLSVQELLDPSVQKAMRAKSDEVSKTWLDKFEAMKPRIKYREKGK